MEGRAGHDWFVRALRHVFVAVPMILVGLALIVGSTPFPDCVPTSADPATYNAFDVPATPINYATTYYVEERNAPPIPGSGFLFGNGTFVYEEYNGLPGLQRGRMICDFGPGCGDWFPPGCDQTVLEEGDVVWKDPGSSPTDVSSYHVDPNGDFGVPCVKLHTEPIYDETCGYGPDYDHLVLIRDAQ